MILLACLALAACSSQPTPTPPRPSPTVLVATVVPIPTLVPTANVPPSPLPSPSPAATASRAPAAATAAPAVRFPAPNPVEPKPPTLFKDGNDIKFVYSSVGRLEANQCYLLHIELVNPAVNPGNRGDDFLDTAHCGDPGPAGKSLTFVLYRGKFTNSPNYGTILAGALALSPEVRKMQMTWTVRVVQNNGRAADGVHYKTVALSPASPRIEFEFQP